MCRKKQKKHALLIIFVGSVISALMCSEYLILNTTASVSRGLWLKVDGLPKKGDFVQVPIEAFSSTEWMPPEYFRKNIWDKNKPFLKKVAGLPGDLIEQGDNGLIKINGVSFPNSAPLSHDRGGRFLRAFPLPVTLKNDEVWLMSDSPFGFDSRYLGTAQTLQCHKAVPLLTF